MVPTRRTRALTPKPGVPVFANASLPLLAGIGLFLFVLVCYWPLTRYSLAQDDFILIERADHGLRDAMSPFFTLSPGQFRPLTKGLYFLVTWPVFGLNAVPYHVVSLLLHALNSVLLVALLRRLGISRLVAWGSAVFFAAHLCHLEALAWASCVQQLIGASFLIATLIVGLDAVAGRGRHAAALAAVAYALALGSYEQTLAAPFVLLAWVALQKGGRAAWRAARGPLRAVLVVFALYVVYAFGLRGMPQSGPYVMGVGPNVLANLRDYIALSFSVWNIYPAYGLATGFGAAWAGWGSVIALHALFRRYRELWFGCFVFLALLAPVLFTREHTHSFHLYAPAIGVCFLVASAVEAIRRKAGVGRERLAAAVLIAVMLVVATGSAFAVRNNVNATISDTVRLPRVFVLRRAVLAQRMCRDIRSKWTYSSSRMVLAYPAENLTANWRNVQSALGEGSAVRLVLGNPDLEVIFVPPAPRPDTADPQEVMVFTEFGSCFTLAEWQDVKDRIKAGADQ